MTDFNSHNYWNNRYNQGKTSGLGSYGKLATYKAEYINQFITAFDIESLIEYGCGDGNNLSMIKCKSIIGLDIAERAIERCKLLMPQHTFINIAKDPKPEFECADLVLSMDVIYHLVEDEVYEKYMFQLCELSKQYIIIYSANFDSNEFAAHVKPRKFTENKWLNKSYDLIKIEKNKYPAMIDTEGSFSDWYIYKRK